jgi:L-2-hydroxyglutarate oxidase LhgO
MKNTTADFIIIGAGVIGLCIARELKSRYPHYKIIVLEKETAVGEHASGRNSGVLHAGFYYTKDSLKAKFTRNGNRLLTQYCLDKNIPINRCGKLVVTSNEEELVGLHELLSRGIQNEIPLDLITEEEAKKIEPRVKTFQQALFSPSTSSVNPKVVMKHILADALNEGIEVILDAKYLSRKDNVVLTTQGSFEAAYIINAAGLYADTIAKDFGFSKDYTILPFKGLYLYASHAGETFKTNIYPVPNLKNPFLGVHFTVTVDGKTKIGPTAIPAFWRENYVGLSRFSLKEATKIVMQELKLLLRAGFDFRNLAIQEIQKYNRGVLTKQAQKLATGVQKSNYETWGKPGIRAQLLNVKTNKLEMDFIIEGDKDSMHVLNAVSPAFTCSMPFASHIVDKVKEHIQLA